MSPPIRPSAYPSYLVCTAGSCRCCSCCWRERWQKTIRLRHRRGARSGWRSSSRPPWSASAPSAVCWHAREKNKRAFRIAWNQESGIATTGGVVAGQQNTHKYSNLCMETRMQAVATTWPKIEGAPIIHTPYVIEVRAQVKCVRKERRNAHVAAVTIHRYHAGRDYHYCMWYSCSLSRAPSKKGGKLLLPSAFHGRRTKKARHP